MSNSNSFKTQANTTITSTTTTPEQPVSTTTTAEAFTNTTTTSNTAADLSISNGPSAVFILFLLAVVAIFVTVSMIIVFLFRKGNPISGKYRLPQDAGAVVQIQPLDLFDKLYEDCLYENKDEEDMFGKSWDFKRPLSSMKDKTYINDTGVSLDFRKYVHKPEHDSKLNIHCSVHDNFKVLASRLNLESDQMLVSPVAELTLSSKTHLYGHVLLDLPLGKLQAFPPLRVHCVSTPLTSFATVKDIPFEKDPESSRLDCFYTCSDTGSVRVYTNNFSLFYCTCCKSDIRFELSAQICARVGLIDGYPSLPIKLFFQGMQNRLKKRQEREQEVDKKKGYTVIEGGEIKLLEKQNSKTKRGFLKCRIATLMEGNGPKWEHVKRGRDQSPIYQAEQVVDVAELIKCWHKEHELCYCINWYLRCERRYCYRLPLVVDVENSCCSKGNMREILTTFTMEVDINTGLGRVQDPIRCFIDSIGPDQTRRLVEVLEDREDREAIRSSQERGSGVETEIEHWYETLSTIRTEPNFSRRLSIAMVTAGVELCDHNVFGLLNVEREHHYQSMARNAPELTYDTPEAMSTGSSYGNMTPHVDGHIRDSESAYVSLDDIKNVSTRPRRQQPLKHHTNSTDNAARSQVLMMNEGAAARPIIHYESVDRQHHGFRDRPTPIGASNDPDETHKKEIADSDQTFIKSTAPTRASQPGTMDQRSTSDHQTPVNNHM